MNDMIVLPTVTACPAAGIDNLDVRSETKALLLRVQLTTETGRLSVATIGGGGAAVAKHAYEFAAGAERTF